MAAGTPLDDDDRRPWLQLIGAWLALHADTGGVITCSALKRSYRDLVRAGASCVTFVHLHGSREVITARVAGRPGHFMPASLVDSQLDTLEPLQDDETGLRLDLGAPVVQIVEQLLTVFSHTHPTVPGTTARADVPGVAP
jgi:gluconokinase